MIDGGPEVQAAVPLAYETPRSPPGKDRTAPALALIALFVCGATVGLFAIVCDSERNTMRGIDLWPAAVAGVGLAGMGVAFAFFLTRRR